MRLLEIDPATFNHGLTRNQAIAAAEGEYVALLTQDAVPLGTDWLQHLVDALESTPGAAGAYGRQVLRADVHPYHRWRLEHWAATRPGARRPADRRRRRVRAPDAAREARASPPSTT